VRREGGWVGWVGVAAAEASGGVEESRSDQVAESRHGSGSRRKKPKLVGVPHHNSWQIRSAAERRTFEHDGQLFAWVLFEQVLTW
jgi:hypothetical protein